MENTNQAAFAKRLSTIERRVRLYHRLAIGLGLMVIASACIAARNVSSKPMTIRATRLDIVNEAGQVVLSVGFDTQGGTLRLRSHDGKLHFGAYATTKGGRLEVLTQEGYELFSTGLHGDPARQGLWERHRHHLDQNRQETNRLSQDFHTLRSQLQALAHQNRVGVAVVQQQREIDRLEHEINQQRRELDSQRHRLEGLERHFRTIERR